VLVEIPLPAPVAPGDAVELQLRWRAHIPERFGTFGCFEGTCTLAGGFYPMLVRLDAAGWDLDAPPARAKFQGRLALAADADVAVQGRVTEDTAAVELTGGPATHLVVFVSPRRHVSIEEHGGVTVTYLGRRPRPPAPDASQQLLPYTKEDYAGMALGVAARAIQLMGEVGIAPAPGTKLAIVEAPMRVELASAQPGTVLVSDRVFRIWPAGRFRKFHEQGLARAIFAQLLARRLADPLAAEVGASYLTDLLTIRAHRKQEFAREILMPVSFIPAIDQLIYAPQVAFADAYFGAVADTDRFRDDPRRFNNLRPYGHLYYRKLMDLLPREKFGEAMRNVVRGEPLRRAAETAHGGSLGWFFRQWRAAAGSGYPRVNYRLAGRSVTRDARGKFRHALRVRKDQTGALPPPVEPVEVRATDGKKKKHELRWDGRGEEGVLEFESDSDEVKLAQLDPTFRLAESTAPDAPEHARYDDRSPPRLKFLYNSFGALLNVTDLSVSIALDFSIERVHDNENSLRLELFSVQGAPIGGVIGYSRYFGRKITPARLRGGFNTSLGITRIDFAGDVGTRATVSAAIGTDDRLVLFEPKWLRGWRLVARWSLTRFDETDMEPADYRQVVSLYGEVTRMISPADGHTIVGELDASITAGDLVRRGQLLAGGGPGLLRGYQPDELFGRARVTGHLEWRGLFLRELDVNLGHFAWLRRMGLAAFTDVGLLSSCDSYSDLVSEDAFYADAGFGLRFFYDNFGVQAGMTAIDVAVPLVHRPRACLGEPAEIRTGTPFMLYLTFIPPF
jgi:hypothetical protein